MCFSASNLYRNRGHVSNMHPAFLLKSVDTREFLLDLCLGVEPSLRPSMNLGYVLDKGQACTGRYTNREIVHECS